MNDELIKMLKYLHLGGLLENWDTYLEAARKSNFSHVRLLKHIVEQEYKNKKENSRRLRILRSKVPEKYVMETFPFNRQPKLNRKKIVALYDSFDYMTKSRNIIWIGPTGVGKTGLATAFLMHAIDHEYKGRFIAFPELTEMLYKSVADHSENKIMKTFLSYDCLLIDEVGYVQVEPVQVGLFLPSCTKDIRRKPR